MGDEQSFFKKVKLIKIVSGFLHIFPGNSNEVNELDESGYPDEINLRQFKCNKYLREKIIRKTSFLLMILFIFEIGL